MRHFYKIKNKIIANKIINDINKTDITQVYAKRYLPGVIVSPI